MANEPRKPVMGTDIYGESPVREFEVANGFTGLSRWYRLPSPLGSPAQLEAWLDRRIFPLLRDRSYSLAENISVFNSLVDDTLKMNPDLHLPSRLPSVLSTEHLILRGVAHGFNPDDIDYSLRRHLLQAPDVPTEKKFEQFNLEIELGNRMQRVGVEMRRKKIEFKAPSWFWNFSPQTMVMIEEQAGLRPHPKPVPRRGPKGPGTV
jgi:hypothetical protein